MRRSLLGRRIKLMDMKKVLVSIVSAVLLFAAFPRTAHAQDYPGKFEIDLFTGFVPMPYIEYVDWRPWRANLEWGTLASLYGPRYEDVSQYASPYVGLRFGYRVKRWLKVGADLGWSGFFSRQHMSEGVDLKENIHTMTFIPKVTFFFATSKYVSAYAGVGMGVRYNLRQGEVRDIERFHVVEPAWQVTPIGVTVGRKVPGFAELTVGKDMVGIKVGVGYRF